MIAGSGCRVLPPAPDLLELAREVAVEVRGPDSARALLRRAAGAVPPVSSIVCYLSGLSHIDPVADDLFLGRFLIEELTALPDIDLDFPRDIREVYIPRVHDATAASARRWWRRSRRSARAGAIRELGKVLGLRRARAGGARGRAVGGGGG